MIPARVCHTAVVQKRERDARFKMNGADCGEKWKNRQSVLVIGEESKILDGYCYTYDVGSCLPSDC